MNPSTPGECCPAFDPVPWDEKVITWDRKRFVKDRVTSVCHIPLNFGAVMTRNIEAIDAAGALPQSRVVLADEHSPWGADLYFEVTKDVPARNPTYLSGTFLTKVFEGPYRNVKRWVEAMKAYAEREHREIQKLYFFYTTCPKCARKYGKNYVVLLAQI